MRLAYAKQDLLAACRLETCLLTLRMLFFQKGRGDSQGFECNDFHAEIFIIMPFGEEKIPVGFVHSFGITVSGNEILRPR